MDAKPGPSTVACVDVDVKQLEYMVNQMDTIQTFFDARDEMNAAVHLQGIRFSPITMAAHELRKELADLWQQAVADLKK